jgi:hypothetical protein
LICKDVKKLPGLNDVKVEQGQEDFAAMQEYFDPIDGGL